MIRDLHKNKHYTNFLTRANEQKQNTLPSSEKKEDENLCHQVFMMRVVKVHFWLFANIVIINVSQLVWVY